MGVISQISDAVKSIKELLTSLNREPVLFDDLPLTDRQDSRKRKALRSLEFISSDVKEAKEVYRFMRIYAPMRDNLRLGRLKGVRNEEKLLTAPFSNG